MSGNATSSVRLLLVQYAGDFREADRVLRETGQETYYNHRYILETLAAAEDSGVETTIMCCRTPESYSTRLASGVTTVGLATDPYQAPRAVLAAIERIDPTHVIFLGPMDDVIRGCLRSRRRMACIWADSFPTRGLAARLRRQRLRRQLNHTRVEWVGNHGRNAARGLVTLGVHVSKVIAWDYLHDEDPDEHPSKVLSDGATPRLFFAGSIFDGKGVFDLIDAVALLRDDGVDARLRVAGSGEVAKLASRVAEHGLDDVVDHLGLLPNTKVQAEMRSATAVVVPSRPTYAEGQPLTINEALLARTPIVASDHPMFDGILVDGDSAVVFPAGDAVALAERIRRLHNDPELYSHLSARAPQTWRHMSVEVKWGDLVTRWIRDDPADRAWFEAQASTPPR